MKLIATQVYDDIFRLMEKIKSSVLALAEARGMTRVQLFALYSIDRNGDVPMGQMAEVLHCDASNITGIVDRLVLQGLVIRQECPTDRRAKKLHLTPQGQTVIDDIKAALPAQLGCDRLTADESQRLHAYIQKMCN